MPRNHAEVDPQSFPSPPFFVTESPSRTPPAPTCIVEYVNDIETSATTLEQQWDAALTDQQQAHEAWKMDGYADGQARDEYRRASAALDRAASAFVAATSDPDQDARDDAERVARVERKWADEAAQAAEYTAREGARVEAIVAENTARLDKYEADLAELPEHMHLAVERMYFGRGQEKIDGTTELATYRSDLAREVQRLRVRDDAAKAYASEKGGYMPLTLMSVAEAKAAPEPSWMIPGLIMQSTDAVLGGAPGRGKSFLSLGIASSIATGTPWLGRAVGQGRVLYCAGEGQASLGKRVAAWEDWNGREVSDMTFATGGVNLSDPRSVDMLREVLSKGDYSFLVVDTFSQLARVESEDKAPEIAAVLNTVTELRQQSMKPGASTLILHHLTKGTERLRGSGAFEGNVDTVILAKSKGKASFYLTTEGSHGGKQRDAEGERVENLQLLSVGNSAVVVQGVAQETAQTDPMTAVSALFEGDVELTTADVVEAVKSHHSKSTVERTLAKMVSAGLVVKVARGTYAGVSEDE